MPKTGIPIDADDNDEETFLVIGIDFGTSQSGVAWAFSTSPDDVAIISSWKADSRRAADDEKCPSSISYDEDGNVTCWGFHTINDTGDRFKNFKLLLSQATRDDPKNEPLVKELATLKARNKKPVDVAADYLRCLWAHTLRTLESTSTIETRVAIDNARFKVVLTVPAIWDHAAQDLTRRAAKQAGILANRHGRSTVMDIISEPEAAALAFFNDSNLKGQIDLKAGDSFVVCDAGGGTVDLISYKIEGLSPLSLSMCSEPTGLYSHSVSCYNQLINCDHRRYLWRCLSRRPFRKANENLSLRPSL
jgi:molecular chaperone DnaK (HSP70)